MRILTVLLVLLCVFWDFTGGLLGGVALWTNSFGFRPMLGTGILTLGGL